MREICSSSGGLGCARFLILTIDMMKRCMQKGGRVTLTLQKLQNYEHG